MMRTFAIAAVFMLGLTGCIKTASLFEGKYLQTAPLVGGNYLQQTMSLQQQQLADEAVRQLVTIWLPAKTQLELQHPTPDAFGAELVRLLRERGYALLEFTPEETKVSAFKTAEQPDAADAMSFPLSYVLDQAGESNLYRVTLKVGNQAITRPYLVRNEEFVPAGYWAYKESPFSTVKH